MKKLVIVALAVAFAAVAQAATVTWTARGITEYGSSTAAAGYVAYLFQVSDTITAAGVESSILDGSFATAYANSAISSTKTVSGAIAVTKIGEYTGSVESPTTVSWFMAIFNAETVSGASYYAVSPSVSQTFTSASGAKAANYGTTFTDTNAWAEIGTVPEPTSGLLLLIGMAGLALKRKQA